MSNAWNYMVDHLSGDLDFLKEKDEKYIADAMSILVENVLLHPESIITYHPTQWGKTALTYDQFAAQFYPNLSGEELDGVCKPQYQMYLEGLQ